MSIRNVRLSWHALLPIVIVLLAGTIVSAQPADVRPADLAVDESHVEAAWTSGGLLRVSIPVTENYWMPFTGTVSASLVTLDGRVLGEASRKVTIVDDPIVHLWLSPDRDGMPSAGSLVVAYAVDAKGRQTAGRVSLARAAGVMSTVVLGSDQFPAGGKTSLRVVCREQYSGDALAGTSLSVLLERGEEQVALYRGATGDDGTANVSFTVPVDWKGEATMKVKAEGRLGTDEVSRAVSVTDTAKILLTTDKPLYQPGQTIRIRSLSLGEADRRASADREVVLEVEDSKGNKVFKKGGTTSAFGIFSADFALASELNLGTYTVRALLGDDKAEKTVVVDRYVLPKFKIEVETDRDYFLPGEMLKGTVRADYFFGKSVAGGQVVVSASKFDVGFEQFAEMKGKTDDQGRFEFEFAVPKHFVGQPLLQGDAMVKLDVSVTDTADHEQVKTVTRAVSQAPLNIAAIPESGRLVAGVENRIYLAVGYPDGSAAEGVSVTTTLNKALYKTGDLGLTTVRVTPEKGRFSFTVTAADERGNRAERTFDLDTEGADEQLLLRTSKAVYGVGDRATLTAFTTATNARTVYFDVIRQGRPVYVAAADLVDGKAETEVSLSDDFGGTVQFRAYVIGKNTDVISDTKVSYINPANDLRIRIEADRESYRPGAPARVAFTVTDAQGRPVPTALGVGIVDESVFALQDNQPGLEKVFYTIERELMKPQWEAHEYTVDALTKGGFDERAESAYGVLLASIEEIPGYTIQESTYATKSTEDYQAWWNAVAQDQQAIQRALADFYNKKRRYPSAAEGLDVLVETGLLEQDALADPWGNPYGVNESYVVDPISWVQLSSAGPDEVKGTDDDLSADMYYRNVQREGRLRALGGGGMMFDAVGEGFALEAEEMAAMPMAKAAMAPPMEELRRGANGDKDEAAGAPLSTAEKASVRVRRYFPETLLFEPALITDAAGRASLSFDMADSITTWRLAATGSSASGLLGSASAPLVAFQDFFVDIDFPVALTEGDVVEVPVAVYNYLETAQTVRLEAETADWYEFLGKNRTVEIKLGPGEVTSVRFAIRAKKIGNYDFTVYGIGTKLRDAVRRSVEILPNGQEVVVSDSGRISGTYESAITIPDIAIDDASTIFVKVYPGLMSQVLEGLDNIFRMPGGCFEQTSSTTYPNIIVLDYMKTSGTITPEIQMKAEAFVNQGYQRLLSFEVPGGGFEWFGNDPAHVVLTAYGLMEFYDMSAVHNVDPNVIARTQRWLASRQKGDGGWEPNQHFLDTVASKFATDVLRNTAYVTWALAYSGDGSGAVAKGLKYIEQHGGEAKDAYTVALIANALAAADSQGKATKDAVKRLIDMATEKDDVMFWGAEGATPTMARGQSADIETTGLAAQALIRADASPGTVNKVINYLVSSKDAYGTWYSTQATVYAIKALTMSLEKAAAGINGEVTVRINGEDAEGFAITPADSDVLRLVDLRSYAREGVNRVDVVFEGEGSAMVQVVGRYYVPWGLVPKAQVDPLKIDVAYDKTRLETGDEITETVTVTNLRPGRFGMVVVDVGVPPGFEVQTGDLAELVGEKTIAKFEVTGRQVIVYLDEVEQGKPVRFSYRLKAKYPLKAQAPKSRVYEYYNPAAEAFSKPVDLTVL